MQLVDRHVHPSELGFNGYVSILLKYAFSWPLGPIRPINQCGIQLKLRRISCMYILSNCDNIEI
jgi:hypothetical protein